MRCCPLLLLVLPAAAALLERTPPMHLEKKSARLREVQASAIETTTGLDLLKWGLPSPGEGSNLLKSRRPLMSTTPAPRVNAL